MWGQVRISGVSGQVGVSGDSGLCEGRVEYLGIVGCVGAGLGISG